MPTRVSLRRVGAPVGKIVALPATMEELLELATRKLGLASRATRVFSERGDEYEESEDLTLVVADEVLFVSCAEEFVPAAAVASVPIVAALEPVAPVEDPVGAAEPLPTVPGSPPTVPERGNTDEAVSPGKALATTATTAAKQALKNTQPFTVESVPLSPQRPNAGFRASKPIRPSSARPARETTPAAGKLAPPAAAVDAGALGAEPMGSTRAAFDRPLNLPKTMCTMPIGNGPMPARPISAYSYSLSRPRPRGSDVPAQQQQSPPPPSGRAVGGSPPRARSGVVGSRVQQREMAKQAEWEKSGFVPPEVMVRPTKPRVPGGAFGKSARDVGGGPTHDPFAVNRHGDRTGGGKAPTEFPWNANQPSAVKESLAPRTSRPLSAGVARGTRARGPLEPANPGAGPTVVGSNPGGPAEFFIDKTFATTAGRGLR